MLVKKTSKNQITLPKAIVRQLADVDYFEVSTRDGEVVLKPVVITAPNEPLKTVRAQIKTLRVTEKDVRKAIRWARGRRN
ncbi:MAG: AbrB/MazE/SpoVT family DNA-binding domain-containing protein [candidate division NC10 bacterium]|nr:AbrB/MazE/SpoVT family DNA-binding domain-containing protein [candidate division NC10 bacterium]